MGVSGHGALGSPSKWVNVTDAPERASSQVSTRPVVVASTVVDTSQATTFTAFTDPAVYSRWLGVPVTISDGRFACTLERGTTVRGRYELVRPHGPGAQVEVHQIVETPAEAEFMERAWALVLGRLQAGVARASDPDSPMPSCPAEAPRSRLRVLTSRGRAIRRGGAARCRAWCPCRAPGRPRSGRAAG